jgi:hypothetical protein
LKGEAEAEAEAERKAEGRQRYGTIHGVELRLPAGRRLGQELGQAEAEAEVEGWWKVRGRPTERAGWSTADPYGPTCIGEMVSRRHRKTGWTTYPAHFAGFVRTVGASFVDEVGVRSLSAAAIAAP